MAGLLLLLTGVALCSWTVRWACERSTIPLRLDAVVVDVEKRSEKIAGVDDVYLLHLDDGRVLPVDRPVYHTVRVGERVRKSAGEARLFIGDVNLADETQGEPLTWSRDVAGLRVVTSVAMAMMLGVHVVVWTRERNARKQAAANENDVVPGRSDL